MVRLNWGLIGGGEGSQIGPAHRLEPDSTVTLILWQERLITARKKVNNLALN